MFIALYLFMAIFWGMFCTIRKMQHNPSHYTEHSTILRSFLLNTVLAPISLLANTVDLKGRK